MKMIGTVIGTCSDTQQVRIALVSQQRDPGPNLRQFAVVLGSPGGVSVNPAAGGNGRILCLRDSVIPRIPCIRRRTGKRFHRRAEVNPLAGLADHRTGRLTEILEI